VGLRRFNTLSATGIQYPVNDATNARSAGALVAVDEGALLERARAGDADAREALVRRYLPDVYRLTSRILGDRDLAQDATQDAFVNALGALHRFRGDASFRTWLLRIAVNTARSAGRRQVRRREVNLVLAEDRPGGGPDPAQRAENATEAERVERVLSTLPRKQRLAVALRIQQGLSYAEIGAALECSEGAARVNYHLGLKRLRELLK
jgi:RNA polymerase sigma-70 factor, ECF subfamily